MSTHGNNISETNVTCPSCGYNLTGAVVGGVCPECEAPVAQALRVRALGEPLPRLSYVLPIATTLLCCMIGGVIAIIYTSKVNGAADLGYKEEYESAKSSRDLWLTISFCTAVVIVVIQLALA